MKVARLAPKMLLHYGSAVAVIPVGVVGSGSDTVIEAHAVRPAVRSSASSEWASSLDDEWARIKGAIGESLVRSREAMDSSLGWSDSIDEIVYPPNGEFEVLGTDIVDDPASDAFKFQHSDFDAWTW